MEALQLEIKAPVSEDIQAELQCDAIPNRSSEKVKSQHLPSYDNYLEMYQPPSPDQFRKKMIYHQQNPIYPYNKETFQLIKETQLNEAEIVIYRVSLSQFQQKISLLNVKGVNPFLKHPPIQRGNYGKVYLYKYLKNTVAVKVFSYPDQLHSFFTIQNAIKQYAITKICAALGCGPHIQSYFGFDLVAYDDSVMFCMEKCVPIRRFTEDDSSALKKNLRLMHIYKIIHFDIKPDNILFSPYFQKAVFIDFGFSQVIVEPLGFKTLVQFRGSPAYCSEEMSQLLGGHMIEDYVDGYHNDLHGLEKTLLQHQTDSSSQMVEQLDSEAQGTFDLEDEEIINQLLVVLLKFAFMVKRKDAIVSLLRQKECFLLKEYGTLVLDSSRIYLEHKTFELIYRELRKQFHDFLDQRVIENYFKFHFREQLYHGRIFCQESIEKKGSAFAARITGRKYLCQTIPVDKYRQFLDTPNVFMNEPTAQRSKTFLIQCLRFDKKYFSIQEKIQLSKKFNEAFRIQSGQNLESIKLTFQHLLEYCIEDPITNWKKENIFLILNQAFMVDLNIEPHFDRLISCLVEMHTSFKDKVNCWMQIYKIIQMHSFKYISEHECMKQIIPYKIYIFGSQLLNNSLKLYEKTVNKEQRHIITALKIYLQLKDPSRIKDYFYYMLNQLKMIQCGHFKNELIELIYLEMLELCHVEQAFQQISQFYEIIKNVNFLNFLQIIQENSTIFHYSNYYIYHFYVITNNYRQITRLFDNISNIINCPQVYSMYKFQICKFLFSDQRNPRKIYEIASQILKYPNSLQTVRFKSQFSQLIKRIQEDPNSLSYYPDMIEKIIKVFTQFNLSYKAQGKIINSDKIEDMMYRYCMLNYFLQLRPQMGKGHLQQILQNFRQKPNTNEATMAGSQLLYYNLYLSINYDIMGLPIKKLKTFENIYQLSSNMMSQKIILYSLKNIIKITLFEDIKDKLLHYTLAFYNFSHQVSSYARYFQAGGNHLITITLYQLKSCQRLEQFYIFLTKLARFVTRFPSKNVILEWSDNIDRLMKEKNYLELMRYEVLRTKINDIFWDNHYYICYYIYSLQIEPNKTIVFKIFAKIAENINFLTTHAKQIVLPTFFKFIILYFQSEKRKIVYLTLRWGYKYLKKLEFLHNLKMNSSRFYWGYPKSILKQKILVSLLGKKNK